MTEKIKALIPSYITVSKNLPNNKTYISHNGKILTEQNADDPGTAMEFKTLDFYMQGADERFALEPRVIELIVGHTPFRYNKLREIELGIEKHISYLFNRVMSLSESQLRESRLVELDAELVKQCEAQK